MIALPNVNPKDVLARSNSVVQVISCEVLSGLDAIAMRWGSILHGTHEDRGDDPRGGRVVKGVHEYRANSEFLLEATSRPNCEDHLKIIASRRSIGGSVPPARSRVLVSPVPRTAVTGIGKHFMIGFSLSTSHF